jgi:hypothetical protein
MADRGWIEGLGLAHPLRHESLLTGIGHESIMSYAIMLLLRTHHGTLPMEWVIRIVNDNVFTVMMGSMQFLRSAEPSRCFAIWAAIPTASRLPTPAWWA